MTSQPNRTLLLITPYFWPAIGGLEHYAQTIAQGLKRLGWNVHVVTSGKHTETVAHEGLTIHRLKTDITFFNTPIGWSWRRAIKRLIIELKPDVINLHAPVPSMAIAGWLAAGNTPVVVTYHAGSMRKGKMAADVPIWLFEQLVLPRLLKKARSIIASSDFVKKSFLQSWKAKTDVVTPGVNHQRFTPLDKPKLHHPRKLVFVGDARDPRKGLPVLLQALKQIPDCQLEVIGQAPMVSQQRVIYRGQLTGMKLVEAYQSADIVILPSTTNAESFGMTLLEAMACGRPVIGSDIGGIPTLVQDGVNGLLVNANDTDALADAIERLIHNEKLATKLGQAGRQTAVDSYSWDSRIEQTAAILEAACGN